ncbi:DUF397 domain-containing protein [Streptosporangium sp. NPDC006013]|uniref:DUF397 domain-containing protein n=1 Tax=Streptosporangium sp. NPDC006013 TaxID=3155596 RepID=UPI0033BAB1CE
MPTEADLSRAEWHKSTRSSGNGGACVEVARNLPGIVAVRDSKNPDGPALVFTPLEWDAFLDGAVRGEFDLP